MSSNLLSSNHARLREPGPRKLSIEDRQRRVVPGSESILNLLLLLDLSNLTVNQVIVTLSQLGLALICNSSPTQFLFLHEEQINACLS